MTNFRQTKSIKLIILILIIELIYRISRFHPLPICHPRKRKKGCEDFIFHPCILKMLQFD